MCSTAVQQPQPFVHSHDELVLLADGGRDASDGQPRVEDGLASGDRASGLLGAVPEAPEQDRNDGVPFLLGHLR